MLGPEWGTSVPESARPFAGPCKAGPGEGWLPHPTPNLAALPGTAGTTGPFPGSKHLFRLREVFGGAGHRKGHTGTCGEGAAPVFQGPGL